jgi:Zn-dependent protease with chaperone function
MHFLTGLIIGLALYAGIEFVNLLIQKVFKVRSDLSLLASRNQFGRLKELLLFSIVFAALYAVHSRLNNSFFPTVILLSLLPSYNFIIKPYFYLKGSKMNSDVMEKILYEKTRTRARVITSSHNFSNAYSYGALPFSNLIIMSNDIDRQLTRHEKEAILFHEVAHLKRNHILVLYLYNLLMTFAFYHLLRWQLSDASQSNLVVLLLCCAAFGLIWYFLPAPLMKYFEYEADRFAASIVGKETYIHTLRRLNEITGGALKNNDFYHPSLDARIRNVSVNDI